MNRQGWKDALYVDKSILNTTQQTRLGEGSKNRDLWDRLDWQLSYFIPLVTLGVSLVKFPNVTWVNYRASLVNIHMTDPFSWGHEHTLIYFSPGLAWLQTGPGYGCCQNYHYPDLSKYSKHRRQWHWRQQFLFNMMNWVFGAASLPVWVITYVCDTEVHKHQAAPSLSSPLVNQTEKTWNLENKGVCWKINTNLSKK